MSKLTTDQRIMLKTALTDILARINDGRPLPDALILATGHGTHDELMCDLIAIGKKQLLLDLGGGIVEGIEAGDSD